MSTPKNLIIQDESYLVPKVVMKVSEGEPYHHVNDDDSDDEDDDSEGDDEDDDDVTDTRSKTKINDQYEEFVNWRETMGFSQINENTLLAYFAILSNKLRPDSLLFAYSIIKLNLWTREKINIRHYNELNQFLKRKCHNKNHSSPNESETLTVSNCSDTLNDDTQINTDNCDKSHESVSHDEDETEEEQPLPKKSMELYIKKYEDFTKWRKSMKITTTNEKIVLNYFKMLAQKFQPSSLMSVYSMLRIMLKRKEEIDLKKFTKLSSFIKMKCKGYKPKEVDCLSVENICDFLNNAPDEKFLAIKVNISAYTNDIISLLL